VKAALPSASSLLAEWSRLLFGTLRRAGARDVIVSPGSRSTPFAWGAFKTEGLRLHAIVDERSAAFFALGLARAGSPPPVLLCTSGSAAANYFPALVEASLSRLPLLVLTADRPFELQHAAAAQTIDQQKLYGDHVRAFFDVAAPTGERASFAALARITAQAYFTARYPEPGPVHVNCRAKKPLEPSAPNDDAERELAAHVDALLSSTLAPVAAPSTRANPRALAALADRVAASERAIIACGPLGAEHGSETRAAIAELATAAELPLFAEVTSQLRFGHARAADADALGLLFASRSGRGALLPELVLRFGAPLTSTTGESVFAGSGAPELHLLAEHGFPDSMNVARSLTLGPLAETARALTRLLEGRGHLDARRAYRARVQAANTRVWSAIDAELGRSGAFGEVDAVRSVLRAVPDGATLMLGNSLPVREVDGYVPQDARSFRILHQRGANGIDGLVSGAAGAAAASDGPTLLLLGDVSFAHDLGAAALLRGVKSPLAVVIVDNGGGRIFEQLPVARLFDGDAPGSFERLFLTPPELALEHAGPLFGVRYAAPRDASALEREVRAALATPGATLIHVSVAGHSARDTKERVERAIEAAFEADPP
jgi:2-succinyl-5-enolpyruvyl-6-hydroxy-3-cyclohexene-1-carboxylate synthase